MIHLVAVCLLCHLQRHPILLLAVGVSSLARSISGFSGLTSPHSPVPCRPLVRSRAGPEACLLFPRGLVVLYASFKLHHTRGMVIFVRLRTHHWTQVPSACSIHHKVPSAFHLSPVFNKHCFNPLFHWELQSDSSVIPSFTRNNSGNKFFLLVTRGGDGTITKYGSLGDLTNRRLFFLQFWRIQFTYQSTSRG